MKKSIRSLLTASLVLALTLTLGCEEKSGDKAKGGVEPVAVEEVAKAEEAVSCKVKLLESITDENDKLQYKFEYDKQNRIVKIYQYNDGKISSTETIIYSGDDLVTVEKITSDNSKDVKKIVKKKNAIEIEKEGSKTLTLPIDEKGYIVSKYGDTYVYENGNLTRKYRITDDGFEYSTNYNYDDKKSAFSNSNTPKWLLEYVLGEHDFTDVSNNNNVIELSYQGEISGNNSYEYKYDSEDFTTQKTEVATNNEGDDEVTTIITRFTYRLADCNGK